ncbi:hypothetical protein V2H45_17975 [Tumidithrix elongata RA019]|uniref:Uncharacterized protein n=1 Tax=Tumidithrix elongata BACA0141 TaxID=2716417 RepID=A0AAW9Q6T2_9CYAN|nr:hypothetical protein [Tumidithrix elongata RA019]
MPIPQADFQPFTPYIVSQSKHWSQRSRSLANIVIHASPNPSQVALQEFTSNRYSYV